MNFFLFIIISILSNNPFNISTKPSLILRSIPINYTRIDRPFKQNYA